MNWKRFFLVFCGVFSYVVATMAQSIVANRFTTTDGLSDNSTFCALRDSYGFLWIGTENGLNCYDGLNMRVYRDMVADENPNETNTVMSLCEQSGDIWFGGTAGLYVFHRQQNRYSRFSQQTQERVMISSPVLRMECTNEGKVWILTLGQGIFIYDTHTDSLYQDDEHGSFFCDIAVGDNGLVYAVTLSGQLNVFRADGKYVCSYDIAGYQFDRNPISLEFSQGNLWMGYNTSLMMLEVQSGEVKPQGELAAAGAIHDIISDNQGHLLIGSDHGVYRFSTDTQTSVRVDKTGDSKTELTDPMVNRLMWDADSTLIVLTHTGGVNFIPTQTHGLFYTMLPKINATERLLNKVRDFCQDEKGNLWIGTDRGLYQTNKDLRVITPYDKVHFPYEITTLLLDGNELWIGTRHYGIRVLNIETGNITQHTFSRNLPHTIPDNRVNSIYRTRKGNIYVLTSWGMAQYDRKKGYYNDCTKGNTKTSFLCMQEDANGWLWTASGRKGLFLKRDTDSTFLSFPSQTIGRQTITSMYCDTQGDLWATTSTGLYRYQKDTGDFERFDKVGTLLHHQETYFMTEDEQGALWLGTAAGIVRLDVSRDIREMKLYTYNDQADLYTLPHTPCIYSAGTVIFGSTNRISHFRPKEMKPLPHCQRIYIQELFLPYANNSREELKRLGLDVLLYTRKEITLPYADNSFTLRFASSRYTGMPATKYEYMLQGFDKDWVHGSTTPEVTYTNLPDGEYEFLLRCVGQADDATARLKIVILPPWYRTLLAYIIYIIIVGIVAVWIYYRTRRRLRRLYIRKMHAYRVEQEKHIFEEKIRFFIGLVHEIRTPLSLISLPLEQMEESLTKKRAMEDEELGKHLVAIRRNTEYLLGITNQLLDFQKQEHVGITLVRHISDVGMILRKVYDQFSDAVEVQGKLLQLQLPNEPILASVDTDKLSKVMMNLVSNAVKYAQNEVIIRLEKSNDEQLKISVIDDGHGIPHEERDKIFDRYYQIGEDKVASAVGTGLGLAYAKMLAVAHGGMLQYEDTSDGNTCFVLTIPIIEMESDENTERKNMLENDATTFRKSEFSILLVEDNEELLRTTGAALRTWYKVIKAHNGIEALEELKYNEIDIVVSDVMMPKMNGIELCQHIKQNIDTSHIPVILLTAKITVDAKVEGMENGADIYMEKPFSIRQLHLQIENLLRLRQSFYERMRSLDSFNSPFLSDPKPLGLNQQDQLFIERLQQLVNENMRSEDFSIDTLAEQLHMSRSSFYRKIKGLTGMTPTDYLKTSRLNQAAILLKQGYLSSEVAERIGFTSSSYFAKCFRTQFGVLPKDYAAQS